MFVRTLFGLKRKRWAFIFFALRTSIFAPTTPGNAEAPPLDSKAVGKDSPMAPTKDLHKFSSPTLVSSRLDCDRGHRLLSRAASSSSTFATWSGCRVLRALWSAHRACMIAWSFSCCSPRSPIWRTVGFRQYQNWSSWRAWAASTSLLHLLSPLRRLLWHFASSSTLFVAALVSTVFQSEDLPCEWQVAYSHAPLPLPF